MHLLTLDLQLTQFLFTIRTERGVNLFSLISLLSSPVAVGIILAAVALAYGFHKQWRTAVILFGGYVATEAFVVLGKMLFHRSRPDILFRAVTETSFSLPSGHAASIAYLVGILLYLFLSFKKRNSWVTGLLIFLGMLIVPLVDLSRLYLGVHYLSDVLIGNLVGFLVFVLTTGMLQRMKQQFH